MPKAAKTKTAQPWPYWMLRYVAAGESEAFEDLIWSVGGSPPYGGITYEEAQAVYNLLESFQGAGQASPEKYAAVEAFLGKDRRKQLALEVFRIHDVLASAPEDLNEDEIARGKKLAAQASHEGLALYFQLLRAEICQKRGDVEEACDIASEAMPQLAALALEDPIYAQRFHNTCRNWIVFATSDGRFEAVRQVAPGFEKAGVPVRDVMEAIGPRPDFPADAAEVARRASDLLEADQGLRALEWFVEADKRLTAAGEERPLAGVLGDMAVAFNRGGNSQRAIRVYERAIPYCRQYGEDRHLSAWASNLGNLLAARGREEEAEEYFREAEATALRSGDAQRIAVASDNLARRLAGKQRFAEALDRLREARRNADGNEKIAEIFDGNILGIAHLWAQTLVREGRSAEAVRMIEGTLAEIGTGRKADAAMDLLVLLAVAREKTNDLAGAQRAAVEAADLAKATGDLAREQQLRELVQVLEQARPKVDDVEKTPAEAYHKALEGAVRNRDTEAEATARVNLAGKLLAEHDPKALQVFSETLSYVRALGDARRELILLLNGVLPMLEHGDPGRARTMAERAIELAETSSLDHQILARLYLARVYAEGFHDEGLALEHYRALVKLAGQADAAGRSLSKTLLERITLWLATGGEIALKAGDTETAMALTRLIDPKKAHELGAIPQAPAAPEITPAELGAAPDEDLERALALWRKTPTAEGSTPAGVFEQMRSWAEKLNWHEAAERLARMPAAEGVSDPAPTPASRVLAVVRHSSRTRMDWDAMLALTSPFAVPDDDLPGICLYALAADRLERDAPARCFWLGSRMAKQPRIAGRLARISAMFVASNPEAALREYEFGAGALANGEDDALRAELLNEAALCLQATGRLDEAIHRANAGYDLARSAGALETVVISRANLGLFLMEKCNWKDAKTVLEEALPEAERLGNERLADAIRHNLRGTLQALGEEIPPDLPLDDSDPDALVNEAVRRALSGDRNTAVTMLEKAFRLAERSDLPWSNAAAARETYARVLYDLHEYDRAIEQMRTAAELAARSGNTRRQVACYAWLAQANRLGSGALVYAAKALETARAMGDREALCEALIAQSSAHAAAGDIAAAIADLRLANEEAPHNAELRVHLADTLARGGEKEEALDIFRSLVAEIAVPQKLGEQGEDSDGKLAIAALLGLGDVERALGRVDSGLAHLRQACDLAAVGVATSLTVEAHNRLGHALTAAHRLFEAVDVLEEGMRIADNAGLSQNHLLLAYGNALKLLGQTDAASEAFSRSRELAIADADAGREARAVHALAGIELDEADYDRARALYLEAASLAKRANDSVVEAGSLDSTGLTFSAQDKPERAIEYHLRAAEMHENIHDYRSAAIDCLNLAQAYCLVREPEHTAGALGRYRRNQKAGGFDDAGELAPEAIEAQMYALQGDWPRADAAYERAIEQAERERSAFTNPAEARRWAKRVATVYNIAAASAVEANQPEAAIEFLEYNRVRFLETVKLRRDARPPSVDTATWTEYLRAEDGLVKARAVQRQRLAKGEEADTGEVGRSQLRLRRARQSAGLDGAPSESSTAATRPKWDQLTTPLGRGETAVWLSMSGNDLLAASASRDSRGRLRGRAAIIPAITSADLRLWVLGDAEKLKEEHTGDLEPVYRDYLGLTALRFAFPPHLTQAIVARVCDDMGARLWPHIEAVLPKRAKRLILIPSAGFNVMPLHAARLSDGQYAFERFEIRYAPSLKALARTSESPERDTLQWKLGQATNPTEDDTLEFTVPEAAMAASTYAEGEVRRLPGRRATVEGLLELLKSCETVHFAGHGFYDATDPEESGLLCAMRRNEPTVLTMAAMLEQIGAVRARLVVLSGCETGLVEAADQLNDFLGLSSALLTAGAESVIGSLWRVNDLATALLLARFFRNWRTGGQSLAGALAAAQGWMCRELTVGATIAELERWADLPYVDRSAIKARTAELQAGEGLDSRPFENPIFWAGFSVNGAGRL